MIRWTITVAVSFVVAAAAPFPSEQEQAEISKPYSECLNAAALRMDDGHSDLATIGKSVADACAAQFDAMVAALGRTLTPEDQKRLWDTQSAMQIAYATVAVGRVRSSRQKSD